MPCNCCTPGGCKCRVPKNDPNAEVESFETSSFTYSTFYLLAPWVHRKYPKPKTSLEWIDDQYLWVADNATYDADGKVIWIGDGGWAGYTRSGVPANPYEGGWVVQNFDGDNSPWYGVVPMLEQPFITDTHFILEEKQDNIKRECQLWVRFRKTLEFVVDGSSFTPWSEEIMIHSIKWDEPTGAMFDVEVPIEYFSGPDKVTIRFFCIDPCQVGTLTANGATWIVNGQASFITESVIEFPLDYCKSYGKGDSIANIDYVNCGWYIPYTVHNKSEKMFFSYYFSCGYQNGFGITFTPFVNQCETTAEPCIPIYNNPYYCCGNIGGGYKTQPDGTISCGGFEALVPQSYFEEDRYNRILVDSKTVIFNGLWTNSPIVWTLYQNCLTGTGLISASEEFVLGTVTLNGV